MNFDNNIPIYIQLVEKMKVFIISGKLLPGEKILSVRELALKYKINPNTVQKALLELENQKLIYTERTTGKFITTDTKLILKYKEEYATNISNEYFNKMKQIGFNKTETIEYIKKNKGEE